MRSRLLLLPALAVVVAVIALIALRPAGQTEAQGGPPGGPPPVVVESAAAQHAPLEVTVRAVGTVEAAEQIVVTARTTGIVEQILFQEGQPVAAGTTLVELEADRERATLQAARAEMRDAQRQLRRLEELVASQAVAESDVDEARARVETAEAQVAELQAALRERTITAPFAGRVGLRAVSPGALVEPGTEITTLATLDRLHLAFSLPAELLPRLTTGLTVRAQSPGLDTAFSARISRIDNTIDPNTRAVRIEAELDNGQALTPGLFATVDVVLESRKGVVVPESAVMLEGSQSFVYTINAEGVAERREVSVGERRRGIAEIRQGIRAGEVVITAGLQTVRAGQPVRVQDSGSDPRGPP